jgi:uncharacterized protein (TIGR00369 family)
MTQDARTASSPSDAELEAIRASGIPEGALESLGAPSLGPRAPKRGNQFEEITVERGVATKPVEGNTQVMGLLHGGATAALAETIGSMAAALHAAGRAVPVGVDLNITHHRGAREGLVRAVATPLHLGRTSTTHAIDVTDEQGRRVASARITNQLLAPRGA